MRDGGKVNYLEVLLWAVLTLGGALVGIAALSRGDGTVVLVTGVLTLLFGWMLVGDLRRGVRAPTRWEWFKAWMVLRPLVVLTVGLGVLAVTMSLTQDFAQKNRDLAGMGYVAILLVFGLTMFYTILRAPRRWEPDAAYRRRIKWVDKDAR
ncbi:MAG: hypothetical protein U0670_02750 [Anaerolineae bacterium]